MTSKAVFVGLEDVKNDNVVEGFLVDRSTPERKTVSELALNCLNPEIAKFHFNGKFEFAGTTWVMYGNELLMSSRSGLFKRLLVDKKIAKLTTLNCHHSSLVSVWLYLNRVTDIPIPMANYNLRDNSLWTHGMSFKARVEIWQLLEYFECDFTDEKIIEWFNLLKEDFPKEFQEKDYPEIYKKMEPLSKRHADGKNPKNNIEDNEKSWLVDG